MALTIFSQCSTITTGCFLYSNNILTTAVNNGYYSNGTDCYTVTGGAGEVTATGVCSVDVYITAGGETTFDSAGDYNYALFADSTSNSYGSNPVCVQASPSLTGDVEIYSSYGYMYASGSIGYNAKCSSNFYAAGVTPFDPITYISLYAISPSSAGAQTYYISGSAIGSYTCSTPLC